MKAGLKLSGTAKVERTDAQLIVSENPAAWRALLLVAGAGMTVVVVAGFWEFPHPTDKIVGWTLGSLMGFVAAGATERTRFVFDLGRQTLVWERRPFRARFGEVPFADVTDVILTAHGDTEGTNYRVVLVTKTERVPLPNTQDADRKSQEALAETVLEDLSRSPANLTENSVAQPARSGDTIAAVTLAKEQYGLSTTRAHALVEADARKTSKP